MKMRTLTAVGMISALLLTLTACGGPGGLLSGRRPLFPFRFRRRRFLASGEALRPFQDRV